MARGGQSDNRVRPIDLRSVEIRQDYVLSMACYDDYFQAIRMDNDRLFKMSLAVGNTDVMLNGIFSFTYGRWESSVRFSVDRPFCLAAVCSSLNVLEQMLKFGAKVRVQTTHGHNALHAVIQAAAIDESLEKELIVVCAFLARNLEPDDWKALLEAEERGGMRPLEYAAKKGTLGIFHQLFRTSTNIMEFSRLGTNFLASYDLSDYESYSQGHRHNKSPLLSLARLAKGKESNVYASELFTDPTIAIWIRNKVLCNAPWLVLWFFLRVIYAFLVIYSWFGVYGFGDSGGEDVPSDGTEDENVTGLLPLNLPDCISNCHSFPFTRASALKAALALSAISFLVDFIESAIVLWNYCRPRQRFVRTPIVLGGLSTALVYRTGHFCLTVCVPVYYLYLSRVSRETRSQYQIYYLSVVYATCALFVSISFGYFVQLFPVIGHLQMLCARLLALTLKMVCVFVIYLTFYTFALGSLLRLYQTPGDTGNNPSYAAFKLLLNQYSLDEVTTNGGHMLVFFHVTFYCVTTFLLLHFSIGIVVNAVTSLVHVLNVITSVELLNAACLVETRVSWLLGKLYGPLQQLVYTLEGGRVFLNVLVPDAGLPKEFMSWMYK